MSRLMSWVMIAAVAAGIWFAWTEGLPRFTQWRTEEVIRETCRSVSERVTRGLNDSDAPRALANELESRLLSKANLRVDESMYTIDLWQGVCRVDVVLPDGTKIHVEAPFAAL